MSRSTKCTSVPMHCLSEKSWKGVETSDSCRGWLLFALITCKDRIQKIQLIASVIYINNS